MKARSPDERLGPSAFQTQETAMTTTVIAHLPKDSPRRLLIEYFDRVYDADKQVMTDEWRKATYTFVEAGQLYQGYCTDTRRVVISEVPLAEAG
jgi:hypothetical protein